MKNTKACAKCGSRDIVVIPGGVGGPYMGDNVHVGFLRMPVEVARYLCCVCGFVEEWIENPEDIKTLKKKYGQTSI